MAQVQNFNYVVRVHAECIYKPTQKKVIVDLPKMKKHTSPSRIFQQLGEDTGINFVLQKIICCLEKQTKTLSICKYNTTTKTSRELVSLKSSTVMHATPSNKISGQCLRGYSSIGRTEPA